MKDMTEQDKSELAKSLDLSVEELEDLIKAGDEDIVEEEEETKEGDEKKDEKEEEEEKTEKSEKEDLVKSLKSDISSKLKELHDLEKGEKKETNQNDDLMKSFGDFREDLMKSIGEYKEDLSSVKSENEELKKSIGEMQDTLKEIASNSQGTKGMRANIGNVIEKSMDIEEDGDKKYYNSKDKHGILNAMDELMEKSTDGDLTKSIGDDMIQLNTTGQITAGAVKRLNKNGIYLKEQREQ